jgi:demethylmenaquinone methyltransferase/2-methoxy-6-polyprenyl-1,4-benzoquinol methylase
VSIARVRRPRLDAGRSYDRLSRWYGLLATGAERRLVELGITALDLKAGERVLEVGFGTGQALETIAAQMEPRQPVYGIDLSMGMCRVAQRRAHRHDPPSSFGLVNADALFMPIATASFDALFLSFVLELFDTPEIEPVLHECRRVLRSEGRLGAVALSRAGGLGLPLRIYEWGHDRMPNLLDCRPIYLAQSIGEAGFDLSYSELDGMWGLPVEIVVARAYSASR